MTRVAPRVPELSEILCSQCGYVLSGLPQTGVCPECGKPILDSIGTDRVAPLWESTSRGNKTRRFIRTSIEIIRRPAQFYRTFTVRGPLDVARQFARIHWWIAAGLFGISGATHAAWFSYFVAPRAPEFPGGAWAMFTGMAIALTIVTYLCLDGLTRIAAHLTTWEATYRGLRLPYRIVLRGMYYHAAHYQPVAIAALLVVEGYQLLLAFAGTSMSFNSPSIYLYVLSAQVVVSAIYLFQTYWIGMRNMMYANR